MQYIIYTIMHAPYTCSLVHVYMYVITLKLIFTSGIMQQSFLLFSTCMHAR